MNTETQRYAIIPLEAGPVATFGYVLLDRVEKKAAVVDVPKDSAAPFLDILRENGMELESIFLTHSHWDHAADLAELKRETGARIYIHPADEYRLLAPMEHCLWPLPFEIEPVKPDEHYGHGDTVSVGGWTLEVFHTPGHTEGGVCLLERRLRIALVGDTLFSGSVGRADLPGGDMPTLLQSIRQHLLTLEDDITIFPGHGPASTIGEERQHNPFLTGRF